MKIHREVLALARILTSLLFLVCLVQGCIIQSKNKEPLDSSPIVSRLKKVKEGMEPLNFKTVSSPSEHELEYFRYYGLDFQGCEHIFGTFSSSDKVLAAHLFKPKLARGTVILLHGYCDHAGVWKHVIKKMLQGRYTVALYDQPGHGLSSGSRAAIDNFSEYVSVLEDFLRLCQMNLPDPYHLAAHSMGGAVALDYLLKVDQPTVDKVALIAPLVHSSYWNISRFGHALGKHFSDSVPRVFQNTSSDKEFLEFTESDPLQARRVPMKWFDALVQWNKRVADCEPSTLPIKVIQGTKDTTVDWKYNMKLIKQKFPNADIVIIENGGHHLINETLPMRTEVIELIADYFEGRSGN